MQHNHWPRWVVSLSAVLFLVCGVPGSVRVESASASTTAARVNDTYGRLPLHFEANHGQTDPHVRFLSRGSHHTMFLTPTGAIITLREPQRVSGPTSISKKELTGTTLRMRFVDATAQARVHADKELAGKVNYFIGNDSKKWLRNIPTYGRVLYDDLYPGIDLMYYGNQRKLEYDFIVHPGANPDAIVIAFDGADDLNIDTNGDLVLRTALGDLRMASPLTYQEVDGVRREVSSRYVRKSAREIGFEIGHYEADAALIIDPVLFYSTFLGAEDTDAGFGVAVDVAGNAYVAGTTRSASFPTTVGAFQTSYGGSSDGFVTKLNPTGSGLVYSTYLGGSDFDLASGIVVDSADSAYITGLTSSADFPTTPLAFQTTYGGGLWDVFLTKLDPSGGALIYSTFVGGTGQDGGTDLVVDGAGNAYATGITASTNFPVTPGAFQPTNAGGAFDAFMLKADPTGSMLVYSSYLGGGAQDQGARIAIDPAGQAYATGITDSANFPTANAFQPTIGGTFDAFVTKMNTSGTGVVYSTFLGGGGIDAGSGMVADALGNAYVAGETESTDFPVTIGAYQTTYAGGTRDAFVASLSTTGSLIYSTYLGGTGTDEAFDLTIDPFGNTYSTGLTNSTDFPTVNPVQGFNAGSYDVFVAKLNTLGNMLLFSTYLGGSGLDHGWGITLDALPGPNIYVAGVTQSANFPTTPGAFQTTFGGGVSDAFVTKITDAVLPPPPSVGKVTGGGTINVSGGIGNFGFIVERSASGPIGGNLQYKDHATGQSLHSVTFITFVIAANTASFSGTCTSDGMPCTFYVEVEDNGEPGKDDVFRISVNGSPLQGGTLRSGNVQIHQ